MRVADLFCGCGGFSLGFQNEGFEIVRAIDNWEPAAEIFDKNFGTRVTRVDLADDLMTAIFHLRRDKPDVILGGPPCQEFSIAGTRKAGERAMLTADFAEIVGAVEPKWFVMENVTMVKGSAEYAAARSVLRSAGYGISEITLDASFYGVPQRRHRFFAVGRENVEDGFLDDVLRDEKADKELTVRQYLGDEFGIEYYYRHPRTWGRRGVFSIDEPAPTIRSTNRPVPRGYKGHKDDPVPASLVRHLQPHERGRIQTFPKWFQFYGINLHIDTMVANAVPVELASVVARAVRRFEDELAGGLLDVKRFREWLLCEMRIGHKSAGDVVSRLRRACRLHNVMGHHSADDAILHLERAAGFGKLSTSVRSQLRRAVRFYYAYERGERLSERPKSA